MAVGDLNGDGKPDLVVANRGSNTVSVLLGNGQRHLRAATNFAAGTAPYSVAVGDLNGDGKPDLVVANYGSNTVSVLLGTGNGTFAAATNFAVGTAPYSVAVADVNGDGKPDLVVADGGSNDVSVLLNNGAVSGCRSRPPANVTAGTGSVFRGDRGRQRRRQARPRRRQ